MPMHSKGKSGNHHAANKARHERKYGSTRRVKPGNCGGKTCDVCLADNNKK